MKKHVKSYQVPDDQNWHFFVVPIMIDKGNFIVGR